MHTFFSAIFWLACLCLGGDHQFRFSSVIVSVFSCSIVVLCTSCCSFRTSSFACRVYFFYFFYFIYFFYFFFFFFF
ncbi:hypothetical protein EDC01DRAFT_650291 [Geopyxis carbonaria]|nr:hypothetical protein EDC01DRAFT_650291 [Geopyxis carbonaria]